MRAWTRKVFANGMTTAETAAAYGRRTVGRRRAPGNVLKSSTGTSAAEASVMDTRNRRVFISARNCRSVLAVK